MKPDFALSLSFEGISLLHRAADGWRRVGDVALDSPDLTGALADLRARAEVLAPGQLFCKLVLPNDQIKYLQVNTGPLKGDAARARVEAELGSATPYQLSELAFDLEEDGKFTRVAAVALETLQEAEAFAVEHAFNPVSFVAIPDPEAFHSEPQFGPTAHAATLGVDTVLADPVPVQVVGPARIPEPPSQPAIEKDPAAAEATQTDLSDALQDTGSVPSAVPSSDPSAAPAPPARVDSAPEATPDAGAMPGFSSRRRRRSAEPTAAKPSEPTPDPAPIVPDPAPVAAKVEPSVASGELVADAPVVPAPTPVRNTPAGSAPRPVPAPNAKKPASVTQPVDTLPLPVSDANAAPGIMAQALAKLSAFRGTQADHKPEPTATAVAAPPPRPAGYPSAVTNSGDAPQNETERMTVFGARPSQKIGGKPKYLGLILTSVLLIFLVAMAAWATLFSDTGLRGLFRSTPEAIEQPQPPETAPLNSGNTPLSEPGTQEAPETDVPDADAIPLAGTSVPEIGLSSTDTAVIDALREDLITEDDLEVNGTEAARYAATGIWPVAPDVPDTPSMINLDQIYFAAIDRTDLDQDAVALTEPGNALSDPALDSIASPPAPGTTFALDENGLVVPTVAGAVSPDGITVFLGRPPQVPPEVPVRFETTPETEEVQNQYLAAFRPKLRPQELIEENERANLDGKSLAELAALRPRLRPQIERKAEPEQEPEQPPEQQTAENTPEPETEDPGFATATKQAVATSRKPKSRPRNMAALVRRAKPATNAETGSAAVASASTAGLGSTGNGRTTGQNVSNASVRPAAPSPASVARQATLKNSINLSRVNLIGVYGTSSNRRALVRLPSGRYKKVKVGDLVDGGKIVAIGESELRYQKGSRNLTLKMPKG